MSTMQEKPLNRNFIYLLLVAPTITCYNLRKLICNYYTMTLGLDVNLPCFLFTKVNCAQTFTSNVSFRSSLFGSQQNLHLTLARNQKVTLRLCSTVTHRCKKNISDELCHVFVQLFTLHKPFGFEMPKRSSEGNIGHIL